jgi:hypothetical protein
MSRSLRRHHSSRIKEKVRKYQIVRSALTYMKEDAESRFVGRFAKTKKTCSCFMCGNPRKFKLKSIKELMEEFRARDLDY